MQAMQTTELIGYRLVEVAPGCWAFEPGPTGGRRRRRRSVQTDLRPVGLDALVPERRGPPRHWRITVEAIDG